MQIGGLPLEDGEGVILFEVDEDDALGPQLVADEAKTVASFEEALERVRPAVGRLLAALEELAPDAALSTAHKRFNSCKSTRFHDRIAALGS